MERLKKIIEVNPPEFNDVFLFNTEQHSFQRIEADDDRISLIIRDEIHKYRGWLLYIPLAVSFLFSLYLSWIPLKIAFLLVFAYVLYYCIFGIKVKDYKAIVFYRKDGIVSYPLHRDGKIIDCKMPFDKVDFIIGKSSLDADALYIGDVEGLNQNPLITYNQPHGVWSFIVWYMDCNRPLPLGKVFDSYRTEDYNRRKKNGFLSPLYPSDIPTLDINN